MKIENLEVGMKIPNYKKLCELLEEDVKNGGTAKEAQLKQWACYFAWERNKNAYVITEIFDEPELSKDGRKKYMQYAEPLLLHYLWNNYEKCGIDEIKHTSKDWSIEIGLTSGRVYDEDSKNEWLDIFPERGGFSPLEVNRIAYELTMKFKEIVFSTAESLEKRGVVQAEKNIYIVEHSSHRKATPEEAALAQNAKQRALEELGVNYFSVCMSREKKRQYDNIINRIYREEYGWDYVYMLCAIRLCDAQYAKAYQDINKEEYEKRIQVEIRKSIRAKLESSCAKGLRKDEDAWDKGELGADGFVLHAHMKNSMLFLMDELI